MSESYIGAELRRTVIERAQHACEYCLIQEEDTFYGCHIDHVISEKHGGLTDSSNLAYACSFCNLFKGSDIASLTASGTLIRLFHPRHDSWKEHFQLQGVFIEPLTEVGEVTVRLLKMNSGDRLLERDLLAQSGSYPPTWFENLV